MTDAEEMSKSAKRRAAKKARDATEGEAPADAPPAPAAKAAAKSEAAPPKAKAAAKAAAAAPAAPAPAAKGEAKAKAKAEAKPATPEPKAKAKAKAEAKAAVAAAEPAAAPAAASGKAKAKAKAKAAEPAAPLAPLAPVAQAAPAKAAGKAAATPKSKAGPAEPTPPPKPVEAEVVVELDDGSGPSWDMVSGVSKKLQKRKEKEDDKAKEAAVAAAATEAAEKAAVEAAAKAAGQKAKAEKKAGKPGAPAPGTAAEASPADVAAPAAEAKEGEKAEEKPADEASATVPIPDGKIGVVIGPKGAKINLIKEKTGVTRIDTMGGVCTVSGPQESVDQAIAAIKELLEKGYMSLQFEDFSETKMEVHSSYLPDIIGRGGCVLRALRSELGVEIDIPQAARGGPEAPRDMKPVKLSIAGSKAQVEKAKEVITAITMYYHHELTHEHMVHEEMDIDASAYRFIIGPGGSQLRHIQNSMVVKVYIPREHSVNQKVVIVGEKDDVAKAAKCIQSTIEKGEESMKGREREPAQKKDKDDEVDDDLDPAARRYMIKR